MQPGSAVEGAETDDAGETCRGFSSRGAVSLDFEVK